jgi:hypothetical protein
MRANMSTSTDMSTSTRKQPHIMTEIPLEMPGILEELGHCFSNPSPQSARASVDKCTLLRGPQLTLGQATWRNLDEQTVARGHLFSFFQPESGKDGESEFVVHKVLQLELKSDLTQ